MRVFGLLAALFAFAFVTPAAAQYHRGPDAAPGVWSPALSPPRPLSIAGWDGSIAAGIVAAAVGIVVAVAAVGIAVAAIIRIHTSLMFRRPPAAGFRGAGMARRLAVRAGHGSRSSAGRGLAANKFLNAGARPRRFLFNRPRTSARNDANNRSRAGVAAISKAHSAAIPRGLTMRGHGAAAL